MPGIDAVIDGRCENSPFLVPDSAGPMANHSGQPNAQLSYELQDMSSRRALAARSWEPQHTASRGGGSSVTSWSNGTRKALP